MTWIVVAAMLAGAIYFLVRHRPAASALAGVQQKKEQARVLPEPQKVELAREVRELALAGYDRGSRNALDAGKPEQFAHELGVMDAVYCVLANEEAARRNEVLRPLLQMEAAPFNRLPPTLGRSAVAEYLVWKFFPDHADSEILDHGIDEFTRSVFRSAEQEPDPDAMIAQLIYSNRYDWQVFAVKHARKVAGDTNA